MKVCTQIIKKPLCVLFAFSALSFSMGIARSEAMSNTFIEGVEGWRIANVSVWDPLPTIAEYLSCTHYVEGGNPGGYIQSPIDADGNGMYFSAPIEYLGDQSSLFGGNLSVDYFIEIAEHTNAHPLAILVGENKALFYFSWEPPLNVWTHLVFPLKTNNDWYVGPSFNEPANDIDMLEVLGSLQGVYFVSDWVSGLGDFGAIDNVNMIGSTLGCSYVITPSSGTVPFVTYHNIILTNQYIGQSRTIAGHIDATLANGGFIPNWRAGFTNIAAGDSYVTTWNQNLPALGTVFGDNVFQLVAEDITPAPYNQPPYPPAGDTDTATCTVTGIAP